MGYIKCSVPFPRFRAPTRWFKCLALAGLVVLGTQVASGWTEVDTRRLAGQRSADNPRPLPTCELPVKAGRWRGAAPWLGCDSVIRNDFPCNDDSTGGNPQQAADIAVDPQGNFVISWYEFRDGDADCWFQRFTPDGVPVDSNRRLNTDVSMGWQGDPGSAIAPDGSFLFSWEDRRDIGNSDVFCQRFDAAGNRLGDNFRVSDSTADGDQDISSSFIAPSGVSLIAWDDRRVNLWGDIYAQFLNPDGSPRGGNFMVNDDGGGIGQYEPDMGGDSSGRFVVAWMDGRGLNPYDWNIFLQRFDSQGNRIGVNVQVTTDDSIQWAPSVGCARTGEFAVCWDDRRRGQLDVYAQLYNAQGNPVGQNFRVNDDAGSTDQWASSVAFNGSGELLAAWTDRRNGNEDVYARRFDSNGNPLGASFRVNDDGGTMNQAIPTVGARPDGGYWLTWVDARDGNLDVYCQRLSRDGSPVGGNFRINDDRASSLQRVSSIGMDTRGYICTGWEDERNGSTDIYRCLTDASGRPVGPNLRMNDDGPGGAAQYYTAVAGGNGKFLVAWTDFRAGENGNIYAQYLDGSGQPVGGNFRVNSDVTGFRWYPYCAMDSSNNAVVIWMDTRDGPFRIYCRRFDPAGNPIGLEFAVSDTMVEGDYASVAMNRGGRFVVAWMDIRGDTVTNFDAYCQMFRSDGSRAGGNIRVNTDPGRTYQGYPACAIDEQGRVAVAWEDTRNRNYNVYLQWLDSTGARLGDNERANDDPGGTDCYSPSCAFAGDGRLAVMFNDERDYPGNPQVYCQRFRPDRSRISHNQRVNEPNTFAKDHHWTVAQSIAASDQVLAFAWTANRRHQGWDIFAKLTDWNLVGFEETNTGQGPGTSGLDVLPTVVTRGGRLRFGTTVGKDSRVAVYDAVGRRVVNLTRDGPIRALDLTGLGAGTYFIVVGRGSESRRAKFVVE